MKRLESRRAPRWLVIGTGALGAGVVIQLVAGLVVIS